eukprot:TRINITY_DN9944_c0_g1_i1.p1 TRINITY_DN9944_c0_g1~~TRINITY_DN9944_c0_g1_i1.p1  ORF type:complete len:146 (+),score=36.14 TRINITY_DN9944_c0_g1_i1:45-482(+)
MSDHDQMIEETYEYFGLDSDVPDDAKRIVLLLKSMGVDHWEPRVINQLLEFMHKYVSDVLVESQEYSSHAERGEITPDDVKLAIDSRLSSTTQTPTRREMIKLATKKNQQRLTHLSSPFPGVVLPNSDSCLTKLNYQVKSFQDFE